MAQVVFAAALIGLSVELVSVESDIAFGMRAFNIVGPARQSGAQACGELKRQSKLRVLFPRYRITRKFSAGNFEKQGAGMICRLPWCFLSDGAKCSSLDIGKTLVAGELALDGTLRHIPGALR